MRAPDVSGPTRRVGLSVPRGDCDSPGAVFLFLKSTLKKFVIPQGDFLCPFFFFFFFFRISSQSH